MSNLATFRQRRPGAGLEDLYKKGEGNTEESENRMNTVQRLN